MEKDDIYEILPKVWPGWKVVRLIGEGAYGKVYEIQKTDFGEAFSAALKVIQIPNDSVGLGSLQASMTDVDITQYYESVTETLMKEYHIMSKLRGNSNIVSYEDHVRVPREDGIGWSILIRMELLTPLSGYVYNNGITRQGVIRLGIDICRALELCRKYKVIHRDIKPENIFISEFGDYKLGDFGVARMLEETHGMLSKQGTSLYMAPEVYANKGYDAGVDIYSLGLVLYQYLNKGKLPFSGEKVTYQTQVEALNRRMNGEALPAPSGESGALGEIVRKACSYEPGDRYQTPTEMREALEGLVDLTDQKVCLYSHNTPPSARTAPSAPPSDPGRTLAPECPPPAPSAPAAQAPVPAPEPETAEQDVPEPEMTEQDVPEPETAEQGVPGPETAEQGVPEPEAAKPPVPAGRKKRRRGLWIAAAAAVLAAALALGGLWYYNTRIRMYFAEPAIAEAASQTLGKPVSRIRRSDMALLQILELPDAGLSDLSDLGGCTGLRRLDVSGNSLTDLSPLSGLSALEELDVSDNPLSDFTPLKGLPALRTLDLRNDRAGDVSFLSELPALQSVLLLGNPVMNADVLLRLSCLSDVPLTDAWGNNVDSMTADSVSYRTDNENYSIASYKNGTVSEIEAFSVNSDGARQRDVCDSTTMPKTLTEWNTETGRIAEYFYREDGNVDREEYLDGGSLDESTLEVYFYGKGGITAEAGSVTKVYHYNDDGSFAYKDWTDVCCDWSYASAQITLNNWNVTPMVLTQPLENCTGFDLTAQVTSVSYGSPYGTWLVYICTADGTWSRVGSFEVPDGNQVQTTVTLDGPVSLAQAVCVPYSSNISTSYNDSLDILDLARVSYDYYDTL